MKDTTETPKDDDSEKLARLSIRTSRQMKDRIDALLRRYPNIRESQMLRHLLEGTLKLAEAKGFSEVMRLTEDPANYSAAEAPEGVAVPMPLYSVLPKDFAKTKAPKTIEVRQGDYPASFVALTVEDGGVSNAEIDLGTIVAIDPTDTTPAPGEIVAIDRGGRTLLRRLTGKPGALKIETDTTDYEESGTFKPEALRGVVAGKIKPFRSSGHGGPVIV